MLDGLLANLRAAASNLFTDLFERQKIPARLIGFEAGGLNVARREGVERQGIDVLDAERAVTGGIFASIDLAHYLKNLQLIVVTEIDEVVVGNQLWSPGSGRGTDQPPPQSESAPQYQGNLCHWQAELVDLPLCFESHRNF